MITRIRIAGMTCAHCVRAVFTGLAGVAGVTRAEVTLGAADVEHDGQVTLDALRAAVAVAGYTVVDGETNRRALPMI